MLASSEADRKFRRRILSPGDAVVIVFVMDARTQAQADALVECWHSVGDAIVALRGTSRDRSQQSANDTSIRAAHQALVDAHVHWAKAELLPVQLPALMPVEHLTPSEWSQNTRARASSAAAALTHQRALLWGALEELARREGAPELLSVVDRVPALSRGRELALRGGPIGYAIVSAALAGLALDADIRAAWPLVAFAIIVALGMIVAWHQARAAQRAEIMAGPD